MKTTSRPLSAAVSVSVSVPVALSVAVALALGGTGLAVLAAAPAVADPAPTSAAFVVAPAGPDGTTYSTVVPGGVCAVRATLRGGAGGNAIAAAGANGPGAVVNATYKVVPGQAVSGVLGGGGMGTTSGIGTGGTNGGGPSGDANIHWGGGGGGWSNLTIGGNELIVAGGGGGAGGGHNTVQGRGGAGGLPTGAGVFAGANGLDGVDDPAYVTQGGRGGTSFPGAGGTHTLPALNGNDGSLRTGGAGANDLNGPSTGNKNDSGAGGGGGYAGGGGGAGTAVNGSGGVTTTGIGGSGGGGGSSFVSVNSPSGTGPVTAVSSTTGPQLDAVTAPGAPGAVTLTWVGCSYDLGVTKSASPTTVGIGRTVTYQVNVTNNGPDAMSQNDLVTVRDANAAGAVVTDISVSGGSNAVLARGPVACTTPPGGTIPAGGQLDCGRSYSAPGAAGAPSGNSRGIDVGETLSITYTKTYATAGAKPNTAAVTDRGGATGNNSASTSVTVAAPPVANPDSSTGNTIGDPVTLNPLANDTGSGLRPTSVVIAGAAGDGKELAVGGEGTWTVDPTSGTVTFTPVAGFLGDPTDIGYTVTDSAGETATSTINVQYVPVAVADNDLENAVGDPVTVDVLANDTGDFDPSTVTIVGAPGDGRTLVVAGQGTWTVDPATGAVTFTPQDGYQGDPDPIRYRVVDTTGDPVTAQVRVGYVPAAVDDEDLGNPIGNPVTIDVLANDIGVFDPSTVAITGAAGNGRELVVPGRGTWVVNPATGGITFTASDGFEGSPAPIQYTVRDLSGDLTAATVTVGYRPVAADDEDLGNTIGDPVTVDVLANDAGDLDPSSVAIVGAPADGGTLVVAGEGTWSVDPRTGAITFSPEAGFLTDPTDIAYTVLDTSGNATSAAVNVEYVPSAAGDEDLGNTIGDPVTIDPLANDTGDFDPTSVVVVGAPGDGKTLEVPGEGAWTVDPDTGGITFTPEVGFEGDPADIAYEVTDTTGDTVSAAVNVEYVPVAVDDSSTGNAIGDPVTVDPLANDIGDLDPTSVVVVGAPGDGKTLEVPGEGAWTVDPDTGGITFTPEVGFLGDPTDVAYEVSDSTGDTVSASVNVEYLPVAVDDEDLGNAIGVPVVVDVLANDNGTFDPTSVVIVGAPGDGKALAVPGEGTWTVDAVTGRITFTPAAGFVGDPTDISYRATDTTGDVAQAAVNVEYVPTAADDEELGNTLGVPVTVDVLANDRGDFDRASVVIVGAPGDGTTLEVPGEGTWTVDPLTGAVTFTPEVGFEGDPSDIAYEVTDTTGDTVGAAVNVEYVPVAVDDVSRNNTIGEPVTLDVLANDSGDLDPTSVAIAGAPGDGKELVVPGEGTWTVDPDTGAITFTPEAGFLRDPMPVTYLVTDSTGDVVMAVVEVFYVPTAADDESLGNTTGDPVSINVLANDTGSFDRTSVVVVGAPGDGKTLAVPGQGTWTVDRVTGAITFTPARGFTGNPTPVGYQVTDTTGDTVGATVRVTYVPEATNDVSRGNRIGEPVTVCPVCNDATNLDPTTVRIIDPNTGDPVTRLVVPGEGVWTVNLETGEVTFTPTLGFTGNPTPVSYQAADADGNLVTAQIVILYLPQAVDDFDLDNASGTTVTVCVVCNDSQNVDPTTVRILDPATGKPVARLGVPREGVWKVDRVTGDITFSPRRRLDGDPEPIDYQVADAHGNVVSATLTLTYVDGPASPEPPPLAWTGAEVGGMAGLGALLLGLGAGFVLVSRRRREDDEAMQA